MKTVKRLFVLSHMAMVSAATHASSAVGTDNHIGNEFNPSGLPVVCKPAPNGLNLFNNDSRTPTGFRYRQPCMAPEMDEEGDGWIVYGSVEGGVVGSGGDDDNVYFVEYADRSDEPTITQISLAARSKDSAHYASLSAGNIGRDDQHLEVAGGKAGSYNIRLSYNEIPHVYATNAKTPYQGIGTGTLTLPGEIPIGGVNGGVMTADELNDFIAGQGNFDLRVDRERLGFSAEYEFYEGFKGFIDYKHEQRDGIKAYGGSFNFDFLDGFGIASVNEVVQPIDYTSDDITVGFYLQEDKFNLNASYTGSFFRNNIDSLSYENPWNTSFGGYVPATGQTDLAPDNDFNQFRLEANYQLPWWKGLVTLSLSQGKMEQDDKLLPFTSNTGVIVGGLIDLDNWNTTAALSRDSAETRIDTGLEQLKISFRPTNKIGLKIAYRHYEEDNKSKSFSSCNAITNQCAFIFLDGAIAEAFGAASLFRLDDPANGIFTNFHHRSIPWDYETDTFTTDVSYRLTPKTKLSFNYELETIERSYREVDETDENKYRVSLVHRNSDWGTLRVEAGYSARDYDGEYNYNPYEPFWTEHDWHAIIDDPASDPATVVAAQGALSGLWPHTLKELRRSDLSERDQKNLAIKLNLALNDQTDLMLTTDYKDNDYKASYGVERDDTLDFGAELSHAPGESSSWFMSYHYQEVNSSMSNIEAAESGIDGHAGGAFYPLDRKWSASEDEDSHMVTLGFDAQLSPRYRLSVNYSFGLTETVISYGGQNVLTGANNFGGSASPVGSFDGLRYKQQILEANLRGSVTENLSWRLFVQYEIGEIDDFHYDGIRYAERGKMLLGTEVDDWDAYTIGVLAQYQF